MRIEKNTTIINGIRVDYNNRGDLIRVQAYLLTGSKSYDFRVNGYSSSTRVLTKMYGEYIKKHSTPADKHSLKNLVEDLKTLFNDEEIKHFLQEINESWSAGGYIATAAHIIEKAVEKEAARSAINNYLKENKEELKKRFFSLLLSEQLTEKQEAEKKKINKI